MQPAKQAAPLCGHSKRTATKGCARSGPPLRVAARKRVCGVAPLGKGWPLPARRALHPSLSRGNAGAKIALTGPSSQPNPPRLKQSARGMPDTPHAPRRAQPAESRHASNPPGCGRCARHECAPESPLPPCRLLVIDACCRSRACGGSTQAGVPGWRHRREDAQAAPSENRGLRARW